MSDCGGMWVRMIDNVHSHGAVSEIVRLAESRGEATLAVMAAASGRHGELSAIERNDSRIETLREVRNAVAKSADKVSPYDGGWGMWAVQKYLTWKLANVRGDSVSPE